MAAEELACFVTSYESGAALLPAIISISSNRETALRGCEVSAARYLAKPLRRPRRDRPDRTGKPPETA